MNVMDEDDEGPVWTEPPPRWNCADCAPEVARLRAALDDAVKGMARMLPYITDFKRQEWQLDAHLHRAQVALWKDLPDMELARAYAQREVDRLRPP